MNPWQKDIESVSAEAVQWRRHLHENPEVGFQEFDTADFIENRLKEFGISDIHRIGDTGILAVITGEQGPGKCIAFRADMDALPSEENSGCSFSSKRSGAAHLCGHDIHTSVLLGTAKVLAHHRKEFTGTVKLIFQPAEELLQGARQMIENDVLNNPKVEAIFGLHCWPDIPAGTVGIYSGAMMAGANNFKITLKGKQGHGAHPHRSIDPIVISAEVINALQTLISREIAPIDPAVLTIGKIHGGTSPNTIPEIVELEGTFRTLSPQVAEAIGEGIHRIAAGIAKNLRGEASVEIIKGLPPLINNDNLYELTADCFTQSFGADRLVRLTAPSMGSEDFSLYVADTPGFFYRLGTAQPRSTQNPPLHSKEFNPDDQKSIPTGIEAMCALTQRLLLK